MLEDAKVMGFEDIVSWLPNSNMFKIHNAKAFVSQGIMKRYFPNQKLYKSFLRQVNIYGFDRINAWPFLGAYFHPCFARDVRELRRMERVRVNAIYKKAPSHSNNGSVGSFSSSSCIQGNHRNVSLTITSPTMTHRVSEPTPVGIAPPSPSKPQARARGMKGVTAPPCEKSIVTKYAPTIPDAFVRDIISIFGEGGISEDDMLINSTLTHEQEYALPSNPSFDD
jgi:HSF-type DNA-binding